VQHTDRRAENPTVTDEHNRPRRPRLFRRSWLVMLVVMVLVNVVFYSSTLHRDEAAMTAHITSPYSVFLDQVRANAIKTVQ